MVAACTACGKTIEASLGTLVTDKMPIAKEPNAYVCTNEVVPLVSNSARPLWICGFAVGSTPRGYGKPAVLAFHSAA